MLKSLFHADYAMAHLAENKALLAFAKEKLSKEDFDKLNKSRRNLIIFQMIPHILLVIEIICVFLFVPYQEVPKGYANQRETIILCSTALYIFFLTFWLILSQFLVGKLWHKYVKWFRKSGDISKFYQLFK